LIIPATVGAASGYQELAAGDIAARTSVFLEGDCSDDSGPMQAPLRQCVITTARCIDAALSHINIANLPFVAINSGPHAMSVQLKRFDPLIFRHAFDADALTGGDMSDLRPVKG
jgi:hypothetical protein